MKPHLKLTTPIFVTVAEKAYKELEELVLLGYDAHVEPSGNIYVITSITSETKPCTCIPS